MTEFRKIGLYNICQPADIVLLLKNGDRSDYAVYRPVIRLSLFLHYLLFLSSNEKSRMYRLV